MQNSAIPIVPVHCFTKIANVGDAINLPLISRLFGVHAIFADQDDEHVLAIGSLLQRANRYSKVWGTGLLHDSLLVADVPAESIHALRGKLSYAAMRAQGFQLRDIPLGDPGFMVAKILREGFNELPKTHRLGVVAHYVDRGHPWLRQMLSDPAVADLNVHDDPDVFLQKLAGCEAVVSSSLHGLVFAEALGIPNIWLKLSEKVLGEGFKFRDWFSLAEDPQTFPELPGHSENSEYWITRARLHNMDIDCAALFDSFPRVDWHL
jgi:Polysaccharide pyruvyl transferase